MSNTTSRAVRDSFLTYVAQNLPMYTVWNIRRDFDATTGSANAAQASLKMNAINIQFVADNPRTHVSSIIALIDLAYQDELTAVDVVASLTTILQAAQFLPLTDFSGTTPAPLQGSVYWNANLLNFKPVSDELAFRRTASLSLYYQAQYVPGLVTLVS